jgi:hypothetical protein
MDREPAARAVVPIEALSQHVAIFGQTGGGKSYVARGLSRSCLNWAAASASWITPVCGGDCARRMTVMAPAIQR